MLYILYSFFLVLLSHSLVKILGWSELFLNHWFPTETVIGAFKGTVQWQLRWVKIGINRSNMTNCLGRQMFFTLPQWTLSREEHKLFSVFSTF